MYREISSSFFARKELVALTLAAALIAGCKSLSTGAPADQQIASDIQAKLHAESALSAQDIQVSVVNGVATLSGNVTDEASRALAGNDSGTVTGVKTVVNNLTVQPQQPASMHRGDTAPRLAEVPAHQSSPRPDYKHDRDRTAKPSPAQPMPQPEPQMAQAAAAPAQPVQPPPPPAPPKPVIKQVTLPAGTILPIRISEALDSKTAQANDVFHGSLSADLGTQGVIAVPHGAAVIGRVVEARDAAHFKGSSLLTLELTQLSARGQKITLVTDTFSKEGAGRGKNTAEKAGGGAVLGTLIGAIAGGGKGAAIGGLAGAAAGTGVNAATRGQQVSIPSETLINFRLQSPVTLTVTIPPPGADDNAPDPQLQAR